MGKTAKKSAVSAGQSGSGLKGKSKSDAEFVTEEIDLDAEELRLREAESSKRMGKGPKTMKPGKSDSSADHSPFEIKSSPDKSPDVSPLINLDEEKDAQGCNRQAPDVIRNEI